MYGFPRSAVNYPDGNAGCFLDDVINDKLPFSAAAVAPPLAGSKPADASRRDASDQP
jgi:hypothetical protein